jgi:hypothetical protein
MGETYKVKQLETEKFKKEKYKQELKQLMIEKKEKRKFEQLMMLSTLSPGGKIQWVTPGKPIQGPLANPFIEKSDIVNHKNKI